MMASYINRGETLLIPFENGQSIYDSQLRPRMYKTMQALDKALPKHFRDTYNVEIVEYAEVKHGEWENFEIPHMIRCSECGVGDLDIQRKKFDYCPYCGAKMDGKKGVEE